jgi:serralysin
MTDITDHRDIDIGGASGENVSAASLDPLAGGTYLSKPIWDLATVTENLNRTGYSWYLNNYGELTDKVLDFGFWRNFSELANSYYVNEVGNDAFSEVNPATFSAFNAAQITMARQTIQLWDDLVSISFRETRSGAADIVYGNTDTGGAQAYAYLPFGSTDDDFYAQFGIQEAGRLGGDVWIDGFVPSNFNPTTPSYYAFLTMVHETGHALGLSHPGDYDALDDDDGDGEPDPVTYASDAAYAQDSLQYSVMSYFDALETGAQHIDWTLLNFAYASTPLVHDIATIQELYGADTTTRTGNTTYGFHSNAGNAVFDFTVNTRPIVTIWDAGGTDTLDFSGWSTPSVIDLNQGAFSSGGGTEQFLTLEQVNANRAALGFAPRTQEVYEYYEGLKEQLGLTSGLFTDNVSIAYGAVIENAIGGKGNDVLIGNGVANKLTGGGGNDLFRIDSAGTSGADRITDFRGGDILAVTKQIADSNGDGIITWSGTTLKLDGNTDTVQLDGISGRTGLQFLGTVDGEYLYGVANYDYSKVIDTVKADLLFA